MLAGILRCLAGYLLRAPACAVPVGSLRPVLARNTENVLRSGSVSTGLLPPRPCRLESFSWLGNYPLAPPFSCCERVV